MRLGGWWRLWIGLSVLWAAGVLAFAFFVVERPTPASVAKSVGDSCLLDLPVPPELAGRVLDVPAQLAKASALDGDANDAERKPISQAAKATVEALVAHAGKTGEYKVNMLRDPQGQRHIVVWPAHFTDAQIYEKVDREKDSYLMNRWNEFQGYCLAQLKSQQRNEVFPAERSEWVRGTAVGTLSLPLASLLLGAFIGWVWRGFRTNKNTA